MARTKPVSKRKRREAEAEAETEVPCIDAGENDEGIARKRAQKAVIVDLGASHAQCRRQDGSSQATGWQDLRWSKGTGASGLGGADVIPTMTAVRTKDQDQDQADGHEQFEFLHGHDAINARIRSSSRWKVFSHLKLALVDAEPPTQALKEAVEDEAKTARAIGCDIKDIALSFFAHVLNHATGGLQGHVTLYMNIVDSWPNAIAQRLINHIQTLLPRATIEGVDEGYASLVGCMSGRPGSPTSSQYLVVDGGHSTMSIGRAVNKGASAYELTKFSTFDTGAVRINAAVERELHGQGFGHTIWGMNQHIDEHFKPDADAELDPQYVTQPVWEAVIGAARTANAELDADRIEYIEKEIMALRKDSVDHQPIVVVITGRALRSKTFQAALQKLKDRAGVSIHHADDNEGTAVIKGLQRIAEHPTILDVKTAPLSLWLRSEPDDTMGRVGKEAATVIRVVETGQSLSGKTSTRRGRHVQGRVATKRKRDQMALSSSEASTSERDIRHPVAFELNSERDNDYDGPQDTKDDCGKQLELDLSVYGTPKDMTDECVIEGTDADLFHYTSSKNLVAFGSLTKSLPLEGCAHVYVFVVVSMFSVKFVVVFAKDGRELKDLKTTSYRQVIINGDLSSDWRAREGVALDFFYVGQIARPERMLAAQTDT